VSCWKLQETDEFSLPLEQRLCPPLGAFMLLQLRCPNTNIWRQPHLCSAAPGGEILESLAQTKGSFEREGAGSAATHSPTMDQKGGRDLPQVSVGGTFGRATLFNTAVYQKLLQPLQVTELQGQWILGGATKTRVASKPCNEVGGGGVP